MELHDSPRSARPIVVSYSLTGPYHPLLLGPERDVDDIVEAVWKVQRHASELVSADHPLVSLEGMNRAERERGVRS